MHIRLTVPRQPTQRHKLRRIKRTNTLQLLLATALSVAAGAQVQSATEVPPGQQAILTVIGKGVQIYECQLVENLPQWVFEAPDASLYNASGAKVGVHGSGPSWRYFDGSSVQGEVVAKSAAPEPTSIPWLLLKTVDRDGSGIMAKAAFIRRSDTHGGAAPATGCDSKHLSVTSRVPYTAVYSFYAAKS